METRYLYGICVIYLLASQSLVTAKIVVVDTFNRELDTFINRYATVEDDNMEGCIESADPSDACTEINSPSFPQNFTMKKIVLINGTSTCDFMTKVQNAKVVGYDVAILFDPFPEPYEYPNITFPLPKSEVNLSVFLVMFEDGLVIRNNYLYHKVSGKENFIIRIFPFELSWWRYMIIGALSILASLAALVFFTMRIWNACVNRFGNQEANVPDQLPNVVEEINEVQRRALFNLRKRCPSVDYSKDDPFDFCVICRSYFEVGEKVRQLRCNRLHAYHAVCIDDWLLFKGQRQTCPLCVQEVDLENSYNESTPLLSSSYDQYSSTSGYNGNGLSNANVTGYDSHLNSTSEMLAEAQGSVNYVSLNESGEVIV